MRGLAAQLSALDQQCHSGQRSQGTVEQVTQPDVPGIGDTISRRFMGLAATVLFAEDDAIIRQSVGQSLMLMGYRVLLADDGYEALRLMTQEDVDLLLTDIVMPGLDGVELARKAKTLRPSLQIMFLTGYASKARDATHLGKLVHKPLRLAQIASEVRDYLAA